ncbi:MAG: cytochrome c biogenesis protein ResB [Phycisphaerae bacterium]|nr:cytochrome c biogenesis protein ResB [Phycisphaerae bacterium]
MARLRQVTLWAAAAALGALAVLSALGAHLGPARAAGLFRSAPMAAVWVALAAALLAGPILVPSGRPIRNAGLLAGYGGGVLILLGAMLGSPAAHRLAARCWGSQKVPGAVMHVVEGQPSGELLDEQTAEPIGALPFAVSLERCEVEYHGPAPGPASQPSGPVKDFTSHLVVTRDGQVLARAAVSANRPLHYGGYHFTQTGCVLGRHALVRLTVVSDWGLGVVYAGFALLTAGVIWQMWVGPAAAHLRSRGSHGHQD